jgi:high affinity Mn2+ porin
VGTWLNSTFAGSYSQATALANPDLGLNANDTIPWTRQGRTKYGFYLNFDQEIADWIGLFGRFSWNDGRNEIMSFTDIDTSLSLGVSIKGTPWGRPDDRVGIAGAWNNISGNHSAYLAAGGLGPLVGDGALSYASENVLEAYYAFQLAKGIVATADYQFLGNPGYNLVRGPARMTIPASVSARGWKRLRPAHRGRSRPRGRRLHDLCHGGRRSRGIPRSAR